MKRSMPISQKKLEASTAQLRGRSNARVPVSQGSSPPLRSEEAENLC